MKIVDCFIFHDELDLLYYRMKILNNVVDYFVICESTKTFVGNDKPLLFIENKHRFNEFANKIVYIKVSNFSSNSKYAWDNENCQRRHLDIGIQSLKLGDNDHVFISDLNEIPDPSVLEWIKSTDQQLDFVACFPMDSYYYNLTTKISKSWNYAAVMSFRHYKTSCNPQELRFTYPRRPVSSNGSRCGSGCGGGCECGCSTPSGWHLSYFGDEEFIRNKILQFSHDVHNLQDLIDTSKIKEKVLLKHDCLDRNNIEFITIPIKENNYLPPMYDTYLVGF